MKLWFALFSLLTVAACSSNDDDVELTLVEQLMSQPDAVLRGEAIYAGSCANFCHGLTPEIAAVEYGEAANLFDCVWQHGATDEEIFKNVVSGISGTSMVGFGSNFPEGDADLWKVIAFLRSNQQACGSELTDQTLEQTIE